jgi:two-component system copper resistance phosphate regulon response regulator CusR
VDLVEDGEAGERKLLAGSYDVAVLDVMLPRRDGYEVCRRLRKAGIGVPILMLTARDAVADRVKGLHEGADDYLIKPFAFDELLARLEALVRRGPSRPPDSLLTHGPLQVDTESHLVKLSGAEVRLSATEYRLLEYLVRRAGSIVSRDQLAEHVWGGDYDPFSNVADVYISYLRKKLDKDRKRPLIHTVRGLGYMLKDGAEREA